MGQFVDVEVVDLKMSPEVFGLFVCLSSWILFKQLRPKDEFSPHKTLCEKKNVVQQIIFQTKTFNEVQKKRERRQIWFSILKASKSCPLFPLSFKLF